MTKGERNQMELDAMTDAEFAEHCKRFGMSTPCDRQSFQRLMGACACMGCPHAVNCKCACEICQQSFSLPVIQE